MPIIGTQQSPIRINSSDPLRVTCPTTLLEIRYIPSPSSHGYFEEPSTGHGNLILKEPYPIVNYKGDPFELRKVHIHLGSEHLVDSDKPKDFEVHLLHLPKGSTSTTDPKVVVGILYKHDPNVQSDDGLKWLDEKLKACQQKQKDRKADGCEDCPENSLEFNPLLFFPVLHDGVRDTKNWFHYQGSLTSEPYSEDVSWFVMKTESVINKTDIGCIEKFAEQHARPIYPINRRIILRSFD